MAQLARPRSATPTRLAVIADPHLSTRETGTSKLFEHTATHLASAVSDINGRDADLTVCVGDITKDGEKWNYEAFDDILSELTTPFVSVPGNHDVPKAGDEHESLSVAAFEDRYTPGGLPFHTRAGGVDLLGLNSAGTEEVLFDSHEGWVPPEQVTWLRETLPEAQTPVVVVHHNLPAMSEQVREHRDAAEPDMFVPPELRDPDPFVDVLDEHEVPLVLTGHLHMPSAVSQGAVREIMAPTTCSFPQSYLLVDVGPNGTEIKLVPVSDFDGTVRGYRERSSDSVTGRGLTAMAAIRLAQFPLIED